MRKQQVVIVLSLCVLLVTLAGCGQTKKESAGQSFGSVTQTAAATIEPSSRPDAAASSLKPAASTAPIVSSPSPAPSVKEEESKPAAPKDTQASPIPSAKASEQKPIEETAPVQAKEGKSAEAAQTAATPAADAKPKDEKPAAEKPKPSSLSNEINWTQFFDDDKQDKPSNAFWDMSGKTVQIKGFMGEVLSFDKHWFLLIPKPGAECPFDNGDETYWNKIMIVFVPDSVKLRYTSGPLLITGKLDVGIKLDESGYKTMFRLYDASFEKIKE
ncbi:hypothetical protein [Paenibacillus alba]|uniref:Lipoprotein n=1 Tax=Paenibacillus alba TaxID=1197127 RepID=A0ABU6GEJ1_9BACL|nr:hypothetical protein [Paenibacillus alba]MEC0232640.1 hypothetical protein [Paenibacillus alba]